MLDRALLPFLKAPTRRRTASAKAESGVGAYWMSTEPSVRMFTRDVRTMMLDAQKVGISNRWIRASERVISHAFGTVPWHLEDENQDAVGDESPDNLKVIHDLIEKPYRPIKGDPITSTPRSRSGLWSLTCRHMGLTGSAFWYLDQTEALAGTPLQILYVNPSRMTPVGEKQLLGWVLDADQRGGGTPLDAHQVLHFTLEEADSGWFPAGLVETAMASVNITTAADRHAHGAFASGGKLAGVFSPRGEHTIPPDVFATMEKELRAAATDPDFARRSMILRGPVEFTPTAATPEQLDLVSVLSMARDDVLGLWGVPLSQLGIAAPAGLNSGGTKSYDEAALWQKAIGPRLRRFYEVVQFQLLDRYAQLGTRVELVIEEPTFDDDAPKYELAVKAQNQPLTNNERRALIGLDPFEDEALGNAIVLPLNMVEYGAIPPPEVKARTNPASRLLPRLEKDIAAFLDAQKRALVAKVRDRAAHLAKKPTDTASWWNGDEWDQRLRKVLAPYAEQFANLSATKVSAKFGKADFTDIAGNRVLQRLLTRLGTRITGINETTRDKISVAIREGIEAGDGPAQLGDRVEAAAAFDEYRAEMIGRTESATVLNEAAIESYREYGVERVRAIDGDEDEECAARNGQEYDLDEAMSIQDHPNGSLDWVPIVGAA